MVPMGICPLTTGTAPASRVRKYPCDVLKQGGLWFLFFVPGTRGTCFFLPESFWDRSGFSIKNDWVFCRNHCASSLLPSIIVVPGVLDLLSPFFPWLLKGSPAKSVKAYHPNSHIIGSTSSILSGINTCFFYFFWLDTPWYPMISQMFRGFFGGPSPSRAHPMGRAGGRLGAHCVAALLPGLWQGSPWDGGGITSFHTPSGKLI